MTVAALSEVMPLLLLLCIPRLGLVIIRSSDVIGLLGNIAIFITFELAFCVFAVAVATVAMRFTTLYLLLRVAMPALQVLAIADAIYTALVGHPLVRTRNFLFACRDSKFICSVCTFVACCPARQRLALVLYFLRNLHSEYVQHILSVYVGIGVPSLVAGLLFSLGLVNRLITKGTRRLLKWHPLDGRKDLCRRSFVAVSKMGSSRCSVASAAIVVAVLGISGLRLPRSGPGAVSLLATGNVFSRWVAEALPVAAFRFDGYGGWPSASPSELSLTVGSAESWPDLEVISESKPKHVGDHAVRNVVVVGIETARADAFGPWWRGGQRWGGGPSITPKLDRLIRKTGRPVTTAYTPTPNTIKAVLALFCGLAPEVSMAWTEYASLDLSQCLPAVLRKLGFATGVFTGGALDGHVINKFYREAIGFNSTVGYEQLITGDASSKFAEVNYLGLEDEAILPAFKAWIAERDRQQPFFAGIFTVTMHAPYATPQRFQATSRKPSLRSSEQAYLAAVEYTDRFIGKLHDQLVEAGLADSTLLVLSGDHGELFGEHGGWQHGASVHEEAVHVPLILVGPHIGPAGQPITGLRSVLDVSPTVLGWLGLQLRGGSPLLRGKPLLRWNNTRSEVALSPGHTELRFFNFFDSDQLAVRVSSGLKLHLDARTGLVQAYNVTADPLEMHELPATYQYEQQLQQLRRWKTETNAIVASSAVLQEKRRANIAVTAVDIQRATPPAFNGRYPASLGTQRIQLPPLSPFGCPPCYERVFVPPGDGAAAKPGWVSQAITKCGYGHSPVWNIVLRFEAFDAVMYVESSDEQRSRGDATAGSNCGHEKLVNVSQWARRSVAYFTFGDLDNTTKLEIEEGISGGKNSSNDLVAHLTAVVRRSVGTALGVQLTLFPHAPPLTLRHNGDFTARGSRYYLGVPFKFQHPHMGEDLAAPLQVTTAAPLGPKVVTKSYSWFRETTEYVWIGLVGVIAVTVVAVDVNQR